MKPLDQKIRIVVPAFEATKTIVQCVDAIVVAVDPSWSLELFVVDNGNNSNLEELLKHTPAQVIEAEEKPSAAYARNQGALGFQKGIIIFIDSDVMIEPSCLQNLIKPILDSKYSATIGNYSQNVNGLNFAQSYKQLYIHHIYNQKDNTIKNDFWTAIAAVEATAFHQLSGFDSNFEGANGEDQEFGIRLSKAGFKVKSVPSALGKHLNLYTLKKIVRNDYKKGITAMSNSLDNDVPLSDNRHAKNRSILAVILAVLVPMFLVFGILFTGLFWFALFFAVTWFITRMNLIRYYFRIKGWAFLVKSIGLIYLLDLVRFTCVISGYANHLFPKKHFRKKQALS